MKKVLLLAWLFVAGGIVWGAQRSAQEALTIARTFFAQSGQTTRNAGDEVQLVALSGDLLDDASTRTGQTAEAAFYVYNRGDAAYVIVSGDDRMRPILGYSHEGAFVTSSLPENMLGWLRQYRQAYGTLEVRQPDIAEPLQQKPRAALAPSVSPLLGEINYNQDAPYNNDCPVVGGGRSVTGCVATAMATILKFYHYPAQGIGQHSYELSSNKTTYWFDYGNTTFDWDNTLPQYQTGTPSQTQLKAIAQLMYACGVAVDMNYSPGSSGAMSFAVADALIDHFGYDANMRYLKRSYYSAPEWMELLKTELSEGRPVIYDGYSPSVGHEFVFDGYDDGDLVHVNWGWGGSNNGYFEVSLLNPYSTGIGGGDSGEGGYVGDQGMILGFQPPKEGTVYTSEFILEDDVLLSQTTVAKGESFTMTLQNCFNVSTRFVSGQLGIIAQKDGTRERLNITPYPLSDLASAYGYGRIPLEVQIPATMTDGTYALYPASKEQRDADWVPMRGGAGFQTQFTLVVSGTECVITPFTLPFEVKSRLAGTLSVEQKLFGGRNGYFNLTLANVSNRTGDDFYGQTGIAIQTAGENPTLTSFIATRDLWLKPGTEQQLNLSGLLVSNRAAVNTDLAEGEYLITPAVQWGNALYAVGASQQVTVHFAYGTPALVVRNGRLEKNTLAVGESVKMLADFSLSGLGNVYSKTLYMGFFPASGGSSLAQHYVNVQVEKNVPYAFEEMFDARLPVGDYVVVLCEPQTEGYNPNISVLQAYFSVTPATGIEQPAGDPSSLLIYDQPVGETLTLRAPGEATMIRIYDVGGQLVLQQQPARAADDRYRLSVGHLPAGYYIVQVQTADGKSYRAKFVKR
ncbi:MAG: thiol protease/hemagglutinin PrtT [Prevotellaceae bacterium]|jgi:hypothetical protein|nr:thiol protease/hemagglutinin PrtT [Prevotellaceae bacterium]